MSSLNTGHGGSLGPGPVAIRLRRSRWMTGIYGRGRAIMKKVSLAAMLRGDRTGPNVADQKASVVDRFAGGRRRSGFEGHGTSHNTLREFCSNTSNRSGVPSSANRHALSVIHAHQRHDWASHSIRTDGRPQQPVCRGSNANVAMSPRCCRTPSQRIDERCPRHDPNASQTTILIRRPFDLEFRVSATANENVNSCRTIALRGCSFRSMPGVDGQELKLTSSKSRCDERGLRCNRYPGGGPLPHDPESEMCCETCAGSPNVRGKSVSGRFVMRDATGCALPN